MIFVNSMSDLFHKRVPRDHIANVFGTMEEASWHTFQLLTKRSTLMRKFVNDRYGAGDAAPDHLWLGVSVEDHRALSRVRHLQETRATVRFLSIEPLLGPIGDMDLTGIHWVIAGGESGPRARPMSPEWLRDVRDQCVSAGVPFFFKQWGGYRPKSGGREIDGRKWDQYPANG